MKAKIKTLKKVPKVYLISLLFIFIVAIIVRFLYFPANVYFGYDQARDSFFALDILKGDLRIIGPPSAAGDSLFPGPLSLYLYSFVYAIVGKDPSFLSIFFRLYNALGVFLVFLIGSKLFDKKVGLLAAFFFAISYEQTQYTLFMSHQPLAVLPVLFLYLGLAIFLFEKNKKGLIIASAGLGFAIQFHYVYIFLIPITGLIFLALRRQMPKVNLRDIFCAIGVFFVPLTSYIIAELKFNFRMSKGLFFSGSSSNIHINEALFAASRFIHDSFFANYNYTFVVVCFMLIGVYLLYKNNFKLQVVFLFFWFLGGVLPYLISGTSSYYYSAAASMSLFILISAFVYVYSKIKFVGIVICALVVMNNLFLIKHDNKSGPNSDIVIQPGMLLSEEKLALDYMYKNTAGGPFAARGLTVPFNINTTWSYLFEWYGFEKYGYVPTWAEKPAEDFPGNMPYMVDRSKLPETQYIISESENGIRDNDKNTFFTEEDYFSKLIEEKKFGTITVQKRIKI